MQILVLLSELVITKASVCLDVCVCLHMYMFVCVVMFSPTDLCIGCKISNLKRNVHSSKLQAAQVCCDS